MSSLSVIIIAKNEAHIIRNCLESVKWADEIIILDSGSSDGTQAICREYTSKVFETDWQGYGKQKSRALALATCDWVLSLDADEYLSPELQQQIRQAITTPTYQAYVLPMQVLYCGKLLKHCGNDLKIRLFKNGHAQFDDKIVHENVIISGKVGKLSAPFIHSPIANLEEIIDKINSYSTLGAEQRLAQGRKGSLATAIGHGFGAFMRTYIFKRGFLDGAEGFMLAVANAEYAYYRYLKLRYLLKNQNHTDKNVACRDVPTHSSTS